MKDDYEPEIDESLLTPAQKKEMEKPLFPKKAAIFIGVLLVLVIACLIVVLSLPAA
ncbi:MAG: hypothetical protein IJU64_04050 [Bacilli bacterium]|nr:hypothetical protein [Bacilli bacterium]